jgi:hypothetical protein
MKNSAYVTLRKEDVIAAPQVLDPSESGDENAHVDDIDHWGTDASDLSASSSKTSAGSAWHGWKNHQRTDELV